MGKAQITYRMEMAGYSLEIKCEDERMVSYLEQEFQKFAGGDGSDISIDLSVVRVDGDAPGAVRRDCVRLPVPGGSTLDVEWNKDAGNIRLDATAYTAGENRQDNGLFVESFLANYTFSLVLQQLRRERVDELFLVHSCGVEKDGRAFLFAGRSGSGKSTIGMKLLARGERVLGDDMIPVSRGEAGWQAHASPMGGDIPRPLLANTSAPLEAVYFLEHSGENICRRLDTTQALASLMSSVVPAQEIKYSIRQTIEEYDHESLSVLMHDASMLASEVPCFSLSYLFDEQPWEQIFQVTTNKEGV